MAQITNLGRARKSRASQQARAQADANALKHGRTKAERLLAAARSDQARAMLDQHRLEGEEDEDETGNGA